MKKKILLTAGGTATTWHFCKIIKEYFTDDFEIHISDINEEYLIPSAIYAHKFHKVPSIYEDNYKESMYNIIKEENIDIIVPLIDFDLETFAQDKKELKEIGVYSTAPELRTINTLSNKLNMHKFLSENNIPTPKIIDINNICDEEEYIIKPIKGFGSLGVTIKKGNEIKKLDLIDTIIQEKCLPTEITAEIYNGEFVKIFQRERVATKSGVCTKMVPVNHQQINESILKLIKLIKCPEAFCIQFMQNKNGEWCIVDCNLRIGAGTSLSTSIGFQLVRGLLASLSQKEVKEEFFEIDSKVKSVLRVYEDIVIK